MLVLICTLAALFALVSPIAALGQTTSEDKRVASYQRASGTVSDKITFCQKALESIHRFEDLSLGAKVLTEKIYDFIRSMND